MKTTTLRKRKANDIEETSFSSSTPFQLVPDVCWYMIAEFAVPPDVYNLCLTSKVFFRKVNRVDADPSDGTSNNAVHDAATAASSLEHLMAVGFSRKFLSELTEGELKILLYKHPQKAGESSTYLATRLLRLSLLSSLERVLVHSKSGITLEAVLALGDLPHGSAVIAGSTMVQACLGVLWEGKYSFTHVDVDIFCSVEAAPQVRSWLVEHANCLFVGFKDDYLDIDDTRVSYIVDSSIHHVEHYGSAIENYAVSGTTDIEVIKSSDFYKNAIIYGENCQKNYVHWKWETISEFDIRDVDFMNKAYHVRPKPGGVLPFDFDADGNIDLVVATASSTAYDLLDEFDIEICKTSWNGKNFKIPNPHDTFSKKSSYEPIRCAIVTSFVKHYTPPSDDYVCGMKALLNASAIIEKVRKDVPDAPFLWPSAASLPRRFDSYANPMDSDSSYEFVRAKYGATVLFHNWMCKLINRLRKYQKRGIEVVGLPTIGFDAKPLEIMSHGG